MKYRITLIALSFLLFSMFMGGGWLAASIPGFPQVTHMPIRSLAHDGVYTIVTDGNHIQVFPRQSLTDIAVEDFEHMYGASPQARGYTARFGGFGTSPRGVFWGWRWRSGARLDIHYYDCSGLQLDTSFRPEDSALRDVVFQEVAKNSPHFWNRWESDLRGQGHGEQLRWDPVAVALEILSFLAVGVLVVQLILLAVGACSGRGAQASAE